MSVDVFDLANAYAQGEGMKHYVEKVRRPEFAAAKDGYTFVSHRREVGTGYFDKVTTIIQGAHLLVRALTAPLKNRSSKQRRPLLTVSPDKAFTPHPAIGARCLMQRSRLIMHRCRT